MTMSAATTSAANHPGQNFNNQPSDITLSDIRNRRGGPGADGGLMLSEHDSSSMGFIKKTAGESENDIYRDTEEDDQTVNLEGEDDLSSQEARLLNRFDRSPDLNMMLGPCLQGSFNK